MISPFPTRIHWLLPFAGGEKIFPKKPIKTHLLSVDYPPPLPRWTSTPDTQTDLPSFRNYVHPPHARSITTVLSRQRGVSGVGCQVLGVGCPLSGKLVWFKSLVLSPPFLFPNLPPPLLHCRRTPPPGRCRTGCSRSSPRPSPTARPPAAPPAEGMDGLERVTAEDPSDARAGVSFFSTGVSREDDLEHKPANSLE